MIYFVFDTRNWCSFVIYCFDLYLIILTSWIRVSFILCLSSVVHWCWININQTMISIVLEPRTLTFFPQEALLIHRVWHCHPFSCYKIRHIINSFDFYRLVRLFEFYVSKRMKHLKSSPFFEIINWFFYSRFLHQSQDWKFRSVSLQTIWIVLFTADEII